MALTTNRDYDKPNIGGDADAWGGKLNTIFDQIDADVHSLVQATATGFLPLSGGTLTGSLSGTTAGFSGTVSAGGFNGNLTGVSSAAIRLQSARTINVTGIATGSVSFNGTQNVTLNLSLTNPLAIADVTGLQTALNAKEPTLDADRKRKTTVSTANPSGGTDGDVWLKVPA